VNPLSLSLEGSDPCTRGIGVKGSVRIIVWSVCSAVEVVVPVLEGAAAAAAAMLRKPDCWSRLTVDDGGAGVSSRGKPDEMADPGKQAPLPGLNSVIVPVPLDSSLQHSHFRQLTNCIQDVHEVTCICIKYHIISYHIRDL